MNKFEISDFIGVFEDVVSHEDCDLIINHFELLQKQKMTYDRTEERGKNMSIYMDDSMYTISGTSNMLEIFDKRDEIISKTDTWIFQTFKNGVWECYQHYCKEYGILSSIAKHVLSGCIKIQKTKPSQGYHVWHCEQATVDSGDRLMLVMLYLNDVNEGGETEFLYQRKRFKPKKGTILMCPASYTHTHRGNVPFDTDKYIITTWIEFVE